MVYPKISIIIPSLNRGYCIEEAILSVVNQNYSNIELIIMDGGSKDNTIEIIKKHEQHIAYWISKKDKGIYDAMNKGIDKATGDWLYFLGTDDILCENIISSIFKDEYYDEYDFLYGKILRAQSKIIEGEPITALKLVVKNLCHQSIFARYYLFKKIGKFDRRYKSAADYHFNIRCLSDNAIKKKFINHTIATYNEQGLSGTYNDIRFLKNKNRITKKYLNLPSNVEDRFEKIGNQGLAHLRERRTIKGLKNIIIALRYKKEKKVLLRHTLYWLKRNLMDTFNFN